MITENNMGTMDATQARDFFNAVRDELGLPPSLDFEFTTAGSACIGNMVLIDKRDLSYPWFTKQVILHEVSHYLVPEDRLHGIRFHKKYAELINKFLAGLEEAKE